MAQPIWNQSTKHYDHEQKTDPKDRIDVEIGDAQDSTEFHPQMKMKRWDNEANVSFRLVHDHIPGNVTQTEENGVITWKKKQGQNEWLARFYEDWGTPEGAYKFAELVMPAKPPTNKISFTAQSKDVDFFYQPPLTQQEIDEGAERPDEVVGSYAIYSKSSGGMNEASGKEYKTGKIGHLHRAKLIDDNGDEIWADYNTDLNETGILTITVDQTWLDNAVYPVIVDPTFGYETVGTSTIAHQDDYLVANKYTLTEDGDVTKITHYGYDTSGSTGVKAMIFSDNSGYPDARQGSASSAVTYTTTQTWRDLTVTPSLTTADYWFSWVSDFDYVTSKYDTGSTLQSYFKSAVGSYSSPPSTYPSSGTGQDRKYSVYATYTAAGADYDVNESDSITITENSTVTVNAPVTPTVNENETITVTEDVTVQLSTSEVDFKINIAGYTGVRVF